MLHLQGSDSCDLFRFKHDRKCIKHNVLTFNLYSLCVCTPAGPLDVKNKVFPIEFN